MAVALVAALATGCPKPPEVKDPVVPSAEPPPPPKCESLSEKCLAKGDTRARVPGVDWFITPPSGWTYAQESDATVAEKTGDKQAVMLVATFDSSKILAELKKSRIEVIDKLSKKLDVQLAQKNIEVFHLRGRDIPGKVKIGSLEFEAWEQEGAKRNGKPGNVVVITGTIEKDKRELVVLAFSPSSDDDSVGAVGDAIQSLKKGEGK
jgi:hypothetical protein